MLRRTFSILHTAFSNTPQYSVLSTQYPVPSTQYSVLSTQYPVPSTQYPVLSTQYPVLSTQYPVPSTQYQVLTTRYPVLSTQRVLTKLSEKYCRPRIPIRPPPLGPKYYRTCECQPVTHCTNMMHFAVEP